MPTLSNMGHPNTLLASSPSHLPFSRACAQYTADNLSEKGVSNPDFNSPTPPTHISPLTHMLRCRRSTRSRPDALCLSLLSTRAILKPPLVTRSLYSPPPPPRPQPSDRVRDLGEWFGNSSRSRAKIPPSPPIPISPPRLRSCKQPTSSRCAIQCNIYILTQPPAHACSSPSADG